MHDTRGIHVLQAKALAVAQRFVDYQSYDGTENRAVAALHRQCPTTTEGICRTWFRKALAVHQDGIAYLEANLEEAFEIYEMEGVGLGDGDMEDTFVERHPEFSRDSLIGVLQRVFYWYHLRQGAESARSA